MHLYISSFRGYISLWILACGATLIAFFTATEAIIRTYVEPKDLFEQSVDVFFAANTNKAIFGDSIVAAGILPTTEEVVNLATGGEPPVMMQEKIEAFFREKPSAVAVLPANVNMLTRQLEAFADYEEVLSIRERPFVRCLTPRHRAYAFNYWRTLLFEKFESRRRTLQYGGETFTDPQMNGLFATKTEESRRGNARGKFGAYLKVSVERLEANKQTYRNMLDFLGKKGVDVCLLVFPVSLEMLSLSDGDPRIEGLRAFFKEEAKERGLTYVDARTKFSEADMFVDATHMSEKAARIFTPYAIDSCSKKTAVH